MVISFFLLVASVCFGNEGGGTSALLLLPLATKVKFATKLKTGATAALSSSCPFYFPPCYFGALQGCQILQYSQIVRFLKCFCYFWPPF